MKLIIDVKEQGQFRPVTLKVDGHEFSVELDNIPEDMQWRIDDLESDLKCARADREEIAKNRLDIAQQRDKAENELAQLKAQTALGANVPAVTEAIKKFFAYYMAGSLNNKINAIKMVRETTNLGLKEAKDLVDACYMSPAQVQTNGFSTSFKY